MQEPNMQTDIDLLKFEPSKTIKVELYVKVIRSGYVHQTP